MTNEDNIIIQRIRSSETKDFSLLVNSHGPAIMAFVGRIIEQQPLCLFQDICPRFRMRFSMLNLQYNCGLLSSPAPLAGWLDKWMTLIK